MGKREDGKSTEYFIGKTLQVVRIRLASSDQDIDTWLLLSVYALAITELWNGCPAIWRKYPEKYFSILYGENSSLQACRLHLNALLQLINRVGGWDRIDSYVMESTILADKFLALYEMKPPVIPLTWDPGPVPPSAYSSPDFVFNSSVLPHSGQNLLALPLDITLYSIILDILSYARVAHISWAHVSTSTSDDERWLFLRLQALIYRLLLLDNLHPGINECIRLSSLIFLLNATQYHGAQVCARTLLSHFREALVKARFWDDGFDSSLRFWLLCTGAMTTEPSEENAWFVGMVTRFGCGLFFEQVDELLKNELEGFLFLPEKQKQMLDRLMDVVCKRLGTLSNDDIETSWWDF